MTRTVSPPEFKAQFGTNNVRQLFLAELETFLLSLQSNFNSFRLLIYGSFITDKEDRSDIDVMAHVCASPADRAFGKLTRLRNLAPSHVDVFTLESSNSIDLQQLPPTASSMNASFNDLEAHLAKGIECGYALELALSESVTDKA